MFGIGMLTGQVKAALWAVLVSALIYGWLWYRAELLQTGRDEVHAEWAESMQKAKALQAEANTVATAEAVKIIEIEKLVYRDRIKEVDKYVPASATSCPINDDFKRLFNAASPASGASDKQ